MACLCQPKKVQTCWCYPYPGIYQLEYGKSTLRHWWCGVSLHVRWAMRSIQVDCNSRFSCYISLANNHLYSGIFDSIYHNPSTPQSRYLHYTSAFSLAFYLYLNRDPFHQLLPMGDDTYPPVTLASDFLQPLQGGHHRIQIPFIQRAETLVN